MAKKTQITLTQQTQIESFEAFNEALLAALALGAVAITDIDSMIVAAGFAVSEAEHEAAKPIDKKAAALAALSAFMPEQAKAGALAVNVNSLARAFGKYGKHVYAADTSNGTSLVTHAVAAQLITNGKCSLPDVLKAVREHLPNYASTGHYNTLKRMLKAEGYKLNVWQAGFSITK